MTVTESLRLLPPRPPPARRGRAPATPRAAPAEGRACCASLPAGEVDTLWSSTDDTPHALARDGRTASSSATGNKGKLYRDPRRPHLDAWSASFPARAGHGPRCARRRRGRVRRHVEPRQGLSPRSGARASAARSCRRSKDTETVSTLGPAPLGGASCPRAPSSQSQTRSGNTETPDATWSDWSRRLHAARTATRSRASARASCRCGPRSSGKDGATPVLDSVIAAYLQRNLRPQVPEVTVHPPGEVFQKPISVTGEIEILGLDARRGRPSRGPRAGRAPARHAADRLQPQAVPARPPDLLLAGRDPNGDTLVYDVYYRAVGDTRFRLLRKGLTRRRARLGHLHGAERPLRRPGRRRATRPATPRRSPSPATRRARPSTSTTRRPTVTATARRRGAAARPRRR